MIKGTTMRRYMQAACLVTALALSTQAHADDARKAEAQARFNEGLALADSGKWEEARLKFLQAVSLLPVASTLFNLANVEARTGHDVDAIEHYRAFLQLAETDPRITDQQRERAKQVINDLLKKVGQIDIRAGQGATISVDGKALAAPPTEPVPVTPGRHVVEASRSGTVRSAVVEPRAGEVATVKLDFADTGAAPPPGAGSGDGPTPSWSTTRIVTVGALATVAVTGGVLSLVFRGNAQDNVDAAQERLQGRSCLDVTGPNCTAARKLKDDRDSNVTLSTVSLIGGATFAAAAIALSIVWPKSEERKAARLVPVGSVGYGGLSLVGHF
jgi:hypothetical protein